MKIRKIITRKEVDALIKNRKKEEERQVMSARSIDDENFTNYVANKFSALIEGKERNLILKKNLLFFKYGRMTIETYNENIEQLGFKI